VGSAGVERSSARTEHLPASGSRWHRLQWSEGRYGMDVRGDRPAMRTTRYPIEEVARRGDVIYDDEVRPRVSPADEGNYVAIDVESGDYEIDASDLAASRRLLARHPEAQIWFTRVGSPFARLFGAYGRSPA